MKAERVRFKLAPPCFTVSEEALRAWLAGAQAGDSFDYAFGAAIDSRARVVMVARHLHDQGLVGLRQQRQPDRSFRFYVVKRTQAEEVAVTPLPGNPTPEPGTELGDMLQHLRELANRNRPCPTNADLARALDLTDADAARYRLGLLHEQGHIRIEQRGPQISRVITITETGKSTSRDRVRIGGGFAR